MHTRLLTDWDELVAASEVVTAVWGDPALATPSLLRAYSHYGNPVLGAFDAHELVGVSFGFLGTEPEVHLHSHVTCAVPGRQHAGIGFALKQAQGTWCLERGIRLITWTFDPMIARNAYFNLHKLGATARRLLPNFYGSMNDAINRGERTDRLEAAWDLLAPHAVPDIVRTVAVPEDHVALRATDPVRAAQVRTEVVTQLVAAFDDGLIATDFDPAAGYCFSQP